MTGDDAIVREFLAESRENLDGLDRDLVAMESGAATRDTLDRVFRVLHTLKGTCGFLGYARMEALAHAAESLLAGLREGGRTSAATRRPIAAVLLQTVDAVRAGLAHVERERTEPAADHASLISRLEALAVRKGRVKGPDRKKGRDSRREFVRMGGSSAPSDTTEGQERADSTVRVDVTLLDRLMNLVGELVLARNQLVQRVAAAEWAAMPAASMRLDQITSRLQDEIMRTRMQPIGGAWSALPRIVRDVAAAGGKAVRLELEGAETGIDKTLLEAIRDPITHLVRNAVDHGIEPPAVRAAAGKPREGLVRLSASHRAGQVLIEIEDDGAGVSIERIRRRARERGLVPAERAAAMTDAAWIDLVFQPGFTTADRVTRVSGRGVGMDVVRTNVEKVGGTVSLESREGRGTTLRITVPLTLAIVPALVVSDGEERYAVPQAGLLEAIRLEGDTRRRVESYGGAPVLRLRGSLLPLVALRRVLDTPPRGEPDAAVYVVVVQSEGRPFGLLVDQVHDAVELVVKPLGEAQRRGAFAGVTVLGDGRVCLILDLAGLSRLAGVGGIPADVPAAASAPRPAARAAERLLLARLAGDWPVAIPLEHVKRLEEIPAAALERPGGREVARHRGAILPLVRLAAALDPARAADAGAGPLRVVVHEAAAGPLGMVVDEVLDVIEQPLELETGGRRPGIRGTALIRGRVTDLLDLVEIVERAAAGGAR